MIKSKRFLVRFRYTDRYFKQDFFFAVAEPNKEKALSVFKKEYADKQVEVKSINVY